MNISFNFVRGLVGILLGDIGGTVGAYWLSMIVMLLGMAVTLISVTEPAPL